MINTIFIIATFTAPEDIGTNPQSLLWLLPLAAAVTIVYKATKVPNITAGNFIKEIATSFAFGIALLVIIAVALLTLAWLITE